MGVPGNADLLLLKTAAAAGGYQVSRSLRFNSADSAYLNRTPASAGNRKTWTWSAWVKRSKLGTYQGLFSAYIGSGGVDTTYGEISFYNDQLGLTGYSTVYRRTSQLFRDVSAWYHIVVTLDTTKSTASERVRFYVNGSEVTAFATSNNPTQNADLGINADYAHQIGAVLSLEHFNGYLADIWFLDGIAATPSDFAETDATTGQWIPKAYTGSKGTNGFHLEFADNSNNTASTLGKDTSGNSNNWTPNNFSVLTGGPTSVAAATGGLPIYNTTGTYGDTKGTGTRTDSNSSSIVLAIPMDGTNNGTTFTDESATIKGSGSAKSITRNGDTKTVTSQSKYYGSSGYFDGTGDSLTLTSSDFGFSSGTAFTIECWFRASALASSGDGSGSAIFGNRGFVESNSFTVYLGSSSSNTIGVHVGGGAVTYFSRSGGLSLNTWYHLAMVRNTSNTVEFFVNGTSIGTGSPQGDLSNGAMYIAAWNGGSNFNGYIQDFRIYKGAAKYTSNFTPPDSTVNTSVAVGNDSLVDTPTSYGTDTGAGGEVRGNYCTWNPLDQSGITFSNGNLDTTGSGICRAALGLASGKWYWEQTVITKSDGANNPRGGVATASASLTNDLGASATQWVMFMAGGSNGGKGYNASTITGSGSAFSVNDVAMFAYDADAGKLWFGRNGTWITGDPAAGTTPFYSSVTAPVFPVVQEGASSSVVNYGQRTFSYQAPSGFKALCDTNLPAPVIAKPSTVMDVKLYTGNGTSQTITGLGFSPDLVWIKNRTSAVSHVINDAVRGAGQRLFPNLTNAEDTDTGSISALTSDGFSVGSNSNANQSSNALVAWCWDAGSSTVTNTQGSITSSVRANASAGFSIITYTGTATSNQTVGHGLGVAPALIIAKSRGTSGPNWVVYHQSLGKDKTLVLNNTDAEASITSYWGTSSPSSTVFGVGQGNYDNNRATTMVAYAFSPVAGYSSFGSYTGNGSASSGPFVYTGFRPRFLLVKNSNNTDGWSMWDAARDPYNEVIYKIEPNSSGAEGSNAVHKFDFLSNGFRVRGDWAGINGSGNTIIFACFAESPFQYARAR